MSIATNLRRELIRHDMTVAVLSERTGVSKASINKYLAGDVKPAEEVLARLADGLGITADELDIKREPKSKGTNVKPETAAKLMGKSAQWVRVMLQTKPDKLPIGCAVKLNGNRYNYYISPQLLSDYTGITLTAICKFAGIDPGLLLNDCGGITVGGNTCQILSTPSSSSIDSSAQTG